MTNVSNYIENSKESAATYVFLVGEPTMSGPRASSLGTGINTAYVKVVITLIQSIVIFFDKLRLRKIISLNKQTRKDSFSQS